MTIPEFARRLDVHRATVYRLIKVGAVSVTNVSPNAKTPRLRITEAAYERFLADREIKRRAA